MLTATASTSAAAASGRQTTLAEQLDLEGLPGTRDERLGTGRRRVVDAAAGVEHALRERGRGYSPPAPSAPAAAARPESGEVSAIDVTAEPMTRPNALTTRTQRRLIVTTGGNCNGSVISNESATTN